MAETNQVTIFIVFVMFTVIISAYAGMLKQENKKPCHRASDPEAMQRYCEVLGVEDTATIGEVKKAFRAKSKALHPNVTGDQRSFEKLAAAYKALVKGESAKHLR